LKVFTKASAIPFDSGEHDGVVQTMKLSDVPNAQVSRAGCGGPLSLRHSIGRGRLVEKSALFLRGERRRRPDRGKSMISTSGHGVLVVIETRAEGFRTVEG
jgi:hypothetical protein